MGSHWKSNGTRVSKWTKENIGVNKKKREDLLCEARKAAGNHRKTLRGTGKSLLIIVINMQVLMSVFFL